ncbi:Pentatricopeptide repeat-containing protein, mitochondrial [Mycena venus]|uniref:Pentatricopeptide repeat-containing protein, mitochondrial n=1 Tax=Mycena venus TaxID=2733690 RepID=A0A8H6XX87_9AGAR|nr:Pentatricopeptide repeat-containing protein, mitochondrial [Mycena venus]
MTEPDAYIATDADFMTPTKSVAMSELVWGSFLAAFLKRDQNDLAAKLQKDMANFGIRPGILMWNMVIDVYSDRGETNEVLAAWRTMSAQGVKPNALTYRALISSLFRAKQSTEALQWFTTFETDVKPISSVEHSLFVYNAVLNGLLHLGRGNVETALSIFQRMQDDGPKPDLVSYNTMLGYHARQTDFKSMAAIINQMGSARVVGDVFTFSTILSALLRVGRTDAPEMVINIMRKQGVEASVATYTAIIQSQMEEQTIQHLQATMRLLDEMEKDRDVAPNEVTYTSVLAGLYRGSWLSPEQIQWYKQDITARMRKRNVNLKAGGYNILIRACLRDPNGLEDGLAFYREMVRNKVPRGDDTWYVMLSGLLDREEWEVARTIVDEMFSSGSQPGPRVLRLADKIRNGQG